MNGSNSHNNGNDGWQEPYFFFFFDTHIEHKAVECRTHIHQRTTELFFFFFFVIKER